MRYRSALPPMVLILAATGGHLGCESRAGRERRAEAARQAEEAQRRDAEVSAPSAEVQEQVRAAVAAFLEERHPELGVQGLSFTPLTPNLFLVGAEVKDLFKGNGWVAQLSAERLRDGSWGERDQFEENGGLLWHIDYASAEGMKQLAERHGFGPEVARIRDQDRDWQASWGHRSWLDDYLLWHFLFNRPHAYGWRPGAGFSPLAPGHRFHEPGRPITPEDARRFAPAAAPTGGRSMVFLGGAAWRPPLAGVLGRPGGPGIGGTSFLAGPGGSLAGKVAPPASRPPGKSGGMFRGGFGRFGHFAGTGG